MAERNGVTSKMGDRTNAACSSLAQPHWFARPADGQPGRRGLGRAHALRDSRCGLLGGTLGRRDRRALFAPAVSRSDHLIGGPEHDFVVEIVKQRIGG